jgi:hypothetical protein
MDRFDKFTDGARKVLTLAQDEAQRLGSSSVDTEHLLLGLVREQSSVGAQVLREMGIELDGVRAAVDMAVRRGGRQVGGRSTMTPRAMRVVELAIDEARRLGHTYIGTEHLLLGLVRDPNGVAAEVLASLGVDLDKVRHEVIRIVIKREAPDDPIEKARGKVEVDESQLKHVLAIGIVGANGLAGEVSLELIALEVRDAGCNLHWKARSQGKPIGKGIELDVSDDVGTGYRTWSSWWSSSGNEARGEILIVPAPPKDAAAMRLELRVFSTAPEAASGGTSLTGEISLRD